MLNGKITYLDTLRRELMQSNGDFRHTALYKLLKIELTRLGYWKNKARGNPRAGGLAKYSNKSNDYD